jgi:hypothetical protein
MKWKFKNDAEPQGGGDGFWYDITCGGYIDPSKILDNENQLKELMNAIELVSSFENSMKKAGLINEF